MSFHLMWERVVIVATNNSSVETDFDLFIRLAGLTGEIDCLCPRA